MARDRGLPRPARALPHQGRGGARTTRAAASPPAPPARLGGARRLSPLRLRRLRESPPLLDPALDGAPDGAERDGLRDVAVPRLGGRVSALLGDRDLAGRPASRRGVGAGLRGVAPALGRRRLPVLGRGGPLHEPPPFHRPRAHARARRPTPHDRAAGDHRRARARQGRVPGRHEGELLLIELDTTDRVAWLRLNRPAALNALDRALTGALEEALTRVAAMDDVAVLVVAGRGRAFCAGNDLAEMATLSGDEAEALATRQAALLDRFAGLPQVSIAAIDGWALGGGLMLAVAQDLRVASDRARFGLPEVTLGFNPAYGIARLLDVVAGGWARELLLTGRTIRASEALHMGLVNRVVASATLEASVAALAADIARAPRAGLAATKEIVAAIRRGERGRGPEAYGAALRTSPDARARIRAFVERKTRR
ncbi:MAG: hypothetical protein DMD98_07850 [Candidatus Rokuibacteriota bacterium]|nr:MAG: hypothetical protein DMD98_07850 [Candidatus Rokubacteria bacterium]